MFRKLLKTLKLLIKYITKRLFQWVQGSLEIKSQTKEYLVVGSNEADPSKGSISCESPLGRALIGQKKNKQVKLQAPAGVIDVKIIQIG